MTTQPRTPLALMVQVEEQYGTHHIVGHVVMPQDNGELHTPAWSYLTPTDARRYDGLRISAYAGSVSGSSSDGFDRIWGHSVDFRPFRIESAEHAKAIATVLGQVERGLAKANEEDGYLADGDFARYVLRVGRALRIPTVFVRNTPRAFRVSGEHYRRTDAMGLQSWMADVADHITNRTMAELVRN